MTETTMSLNPESHRFSLKSSTTMLKKPCRAAFKLASIAAYLDLLCLDRFPCFLFELP